MQVVYFKNPNTFFTKLKIADTLVQLTELLFLKVKLISELCKLEEKIQLGEHRISALENTGTLN